jgi:hypothetical protein
MWERRKGGGSMVVRACLLLAPLWLEKIGEKGQQLDLWLAKK